jgi:hypothetical protein
MSIELPEGDYRVRVIGQELRKPQNGGRVYLSLKVEVIGESKNRFIAFYFTEKAAKNSMESLVELGFDKPGFQYFDPTFQGFHDFTGVEFDAYCKHEEYNGVPREKWQKSFNKPAEPADKDELRKLNSLYTDLLPKKGPTVVKAPPPKPAPKPEPVAVGADGDDDIPF